ncbi:MAG: hypothetical protein GWP14_05690 [Actinobacteria bacterium]|nr:hypothetical protein [Actinomycetota bacterium]
MTGMTVIVKTITRWTAALIFLYGAYLVLYGHLSVGGGFAGGIILACSYVIMILAYGGKETIHALPKAVAARLDSIGALAFLILASLGMFGGFFFSNWIRDIWPGQQFRVFSAGIIPLANIAIALKVCVSLFLIFFILASLRMTRKGDKIEFRSEEVD